MSENKKIYTITLHSAYNYGSCLQAYALQQYVEGLEPSISYRIINLRTWEQRRYYGDILCSLSRKQAVIRALFLGTSLKDFYLKNILFETFINKYLHITKEYSNIDELREVDFGNSYLLAGSDQIWNYTYMIDFDWAYLLDFSNSNKKISYAVSAGPKEQDANSKKFNKFIENIKKFKSISVRDCSLSKFINNNAGIEATVNIDPTLLLKKEQWEKLIPQDFTPPFDKYILLYHFDNEEAIEVAHRISRVLKIPVVTTRYNSKAEAKHMFKRCYATGPREFLGLVRDATYVVTSSFHGCVFSTLFHKQFYAVNSINDQRLNTFLKQFSLQNRVVDRHNCKDFVKDDKPADFTQAEEELTKQRELSKQYLMKALDLL